jgi:hypothetical protein
MIKALALFLFGGIFFGYHSRIGIKGKGPIGY